MARLQIVGLKVEVQGLGSQAGAQKTREMKVKERNGEKSKSPPSQNRVWGTWLRVKSLLRIILKTAPFDGGRMMRLKWAREPMRKIERLAGCALVASICVLPVLGEGRTRGKEGGSATEELRSLMTAGLAAARTGDQAKLEEIARSLMIPNYEAWFKGTFGEEQGTKLAATYKTDFDRQENGFRSYSSRCPNKRAKSWWRMRGNRGMRGAAPGVGECS